MVERDSSWICRLTTLVLAGDGRLVRLFMNPRTKDTSGVDAVAYYASEELLRAEQLEARPAFHPQDAFHKTREAAPARRMLTGS